MTSEMLKHEASYAEKASTALKEPLPKLWRQTCEWTLPIQGVVQIYRSYSV